MSPTIKIGMAALVFTVAGCRLFGAGPATPPPITLFATGDRGVTRFRIPNLHETRRGTVLAFAEARYGNAHDGAPADLVLRRSTDAGQTWGAIQYIVRHAADANLVFPALAEDGTTGRLFFFYAERSGGIEGASRNLYLTSDDDGVTWSTPTELTATLVAADRALQEAIHAGRAGAQFSGEQAERYARTIFVFGPGGPIQLSARNPSHPGRLVVPVFAMKDRVATPRIKRGYGDGVLVSDDDGRTWHAHMAPIGDGESTEVDVLELDDGRLVLNARQSPSTTPTSPPGRMLSFSHDGGDTWTRPMRDTSGIPHYAETHSSLIRYTDPASDPTKTSRLLFSFPAEKRAHGTILLSYDDHRSWPVRREIVSGSFGYSNMTVLPDKSVLLIYEGSPETGIQVTRFTLGWLTRGRDSLSSGPRR